MILEIYKQWLNEKNKPTKNTPKTSPATNKPVHIWIGDEKDHPEQKKKLDEGLFDFFKKKKFEDPNEKIKAIQAQKAAARKNQLERKKRDFARDQRWSNHHGDDLTDDEKASVRYYTGNNGHRHINKRLWHGPNKDPELRQYTDKHIKTLHRLLNRSTAPESTILTRGTRHLPDHVKPGDVIHAPGFSSATRDAKAAREFSSAHALHDSLHNHQHHYWQANHHDSDGKPKEGTSANGTKVKHGDKYDPEKHGKKPEWPSVDYHQHVEKAGGSFEPANHIIKIRVKKGQRGVRSMTNPVSQANDEHETLIDDEHETLINAGANYRVQHQTYDADTNTVTTHVSLEGHSSLHDGIT